MNKVLLTTLHSQNNNFGSVSQAYALSAFVESLGYDIQTLDYRPYYSNGLTGPSRLIKMAAGRMLYGEEVREREKKFQRFISSRKLTNRFTKYEELQNTDFSSFDIFLLGSDQVWNPHFNCGNDPAYYYDFVNSRNLVAYSSSAGCVLSNEEMKNLAEKTKRFKYISVREDVTANQFVKFNRDDVKHTVDPVFLMSAKEYCTLYAQSQVYPWEVKHKGEPYILAYIINSDPLVSNIIDSIRAETGMRVVQVGGLASKCNSDVFARNAGPLDFLRLIDNASLVVTSSFHGVAFSHIFEKQFVVVLPEGNHLRIESMLRMAGTSDRLVSSESQAVSLLNSEISYDVTSSILSNQIDRSKRYLASALAAFGGC